MLVPNIKGYERARAAGADAIAVFTAASENFTKRNINMTIDESLATFREVVVAAKRDGIWVRGYVSTAFGSPFGDIVTPAMVVDVSRKLLEMGCDELSIGDTIGVGVPSQVDELYAGRSCASFRSIGSPITFTTRAARRWRTSTRRCNTACTSSTARQAASAAARTRPAPPATSAPKTCSICSKAWASKPASISQKCAPPRASFAACSTTN